MLSKGLRDTISHKITNDIYKQYLSDNTAENESIKSLIRVYIISLAMLVSYCKEPEFIKEAFDKLRDQKLDSNEFYKLMFEKQKDNTAFECAVLPICLLKDLCSGDYSKINTAGQAAAILKEVCFICDTKDCDSVEALQIAAKYNILPEILPYLLMDTIDNIPEYLDCNLVLLDGDIDAKKLTQIFQDNLENVAFATKKKLDMINNVQSSKENIENASWAQKVVATRNNKSVTFDSRLNVTKI